MPRPRVPMCSKDILGKTTPPTSELMESGFRSSGRPTQQLAPVASGSAATSSSSSSRACQWEARPRPCHVEPDKDGLQRSLRRSFRGRSGDSAGSGVGEGINLDSGLPIQRTPMLGWVELFRWLWCRRETNRRPLEGGPASSRCFK